MNSTKPDKKIQRQELLDLHTHYESVIKDELDFFFKYFNFYITLLSAMVAATLTGYINLKGSITINTKLILLAGPLLILCLSVIAYYFIRVYYRRFLEALVTKINIKSLLKYSEKPDFADNISLPIKYPSKYGGGFITQFDRKETKRILDEGFKNGWYAEDVLDKLLRKGDTFRFAKVTLIIYSGVAIGLAIFICLSKQPSC